MSALACPHCQSESPGPADFCADCGKALPVNSGPRIIGAREIATSTTGQVVQSEELRKKVRSAFGTLLAIAIFQLLFGIGFAVAGIVKMSNTPGPVNWQSGQSPPGFDNLFAGIVMGIIGIVFLGIAIWARFMPLAAAITGLTIYGLLTALELLIAIVTQSSPGNMFIRILIIAGLVRAVQAGLQHRQLKRQLAAQGIAA